MGWGALAGLTGLGAARPGALVDQFGADIWAGSGGVLADHPAAGPGQAATCRAPSRSCCPASRSRSSACIDAEFRRRRTIDRSEIMTRPLQSAHHGVATDTWASLALGFGTGAADRRAHGRKGVDDFMMTAPWRGLIEVAVPTRGRSPGLARWVSSRHRSCQAGSSENWLRSCSAPAFRAAPDAPSPSLPAASYCRGRARSGHPVYRAR